MQIADLRSAFLAQDDLPAHMERLEELETQALQLIDDEPLKLGSIGSAILDTYQASLTGHYVMSRFYAHVNSPEAAEPHLLWVRNIRTDIEAHGDGSRDRPYPAVTAIEAQIYAISGQMMPVGSIYQTGEIYPFSLLLQVKPADLPIRGMNFDLSSVYDATRMDFAGSTDAPEFSPFSLIGYLAKRGDSAAQAAIGAFLATQDRTDDAIDWLRSASQRGNLIANSVLARIYWDKASATSDPQQRSDALDEVLENYLHAVALGSTDAMYALGVLYLNGHFGEENKTSGIALLQQAASGEHSEAAMFLAHINYVGELVPRNPAIAREYYVRAALLGNAFAKRSYARFLLDRDTGQAPDPRAIVWLEELAEQQDDAEAMLLLGNLHARGVGLTASPRRAIGWYKKAVKTAPQDAGIVNEVAWTLTVSNLTGLPRQRYALSIMDTLMDANEEARMRPEYLDTWAAANAANGDFARAIILQEQALEVAAALEFEEVIDILQEHLDAFRNGQTITETAP
ncbi:MAG: tetratricopeptide repeat protein [Pseudomonadales bacterium]|nr:sel1 repeat family protein [Pseudomonadales bacterium]